MISNGNFEFVAPTNLTLFVKSAYGLTRGTAEKVRAYVFVSICCSSTFLALIYRSLTRVLMLR